jgi:hypothetical protein
MPDKIDDDTLRSIIAAKTSSAESMMTTISFERENSLKLYNQELFGNEREGFSKFVTSEVRDTIEWMLPQLVEMFISGDNPVIFSPQNDKDIEGAKQESQYVRYVYNRQNNGFLNTYTWFKDALMQKNGIIKVFWDDNIQDTKEEYQKQSIGELIQINEDEELEITSIVVKVDDKSVGTFKSIEAFSKSIESGKIPIVDETGNLLDITIDVKADRTLNLSQVRIQPVAPENFWIDPTYPSIDLQETTFCREDILNLTVSDLIVEGFDEDLIAQIPSSKIRMNDSEQIERYRKEDGLLRNTLGVDDEQNRFVDVSDVYLRIDMDGDGIAELRHIKIGGDTIILSNEEVDKIPYFMTTPVINTHKVFGMSVADMIADLQLLSSTIMRQTLDSLYLSNNPRMGVLRGHVELDDLMTSQVGGIVRMDVPNAVTPLVTPFVGQHSIPMMQLIEEMNEKRTGVSSTTQGLNPETLADSTNMVGAMIMNAAQGRIKMIARIFAEVGFKPAMLYVHELVLKNEDNKKIADLGGEFVEVNPTDWKTRRDMQVKVGIGHSEKKEKIISLERILNAQKDIFAVSGAAGPLLNPQNIHNALQDLLELTGMDTSDRYFANPAEFKPPPPKEDVTSEALEIAEAELTANTTQKAAQFKLDVETQRAKASNDAEKTANEKAKILIQAQGTAQESKVNALFKAAEMQGKEEDRIFNVLKEAANVQANQTNGTNPASQGAAGQQGVQNGTGGGF